MPRHCWKAYVAYCLACVRDRIQETECLMRPPTPQELLYLQQVLQRLKEQEAQLTYALTTVPSTGLFDGSALDVRTALPTDHGSLFT